MKKITTTTMDSKNICYVMDSCPAYALPEQFNVARNLKYFYKQIELSDKYLIERIWNNRIYFIDGDDIIMSENVDSTFGKFVKRTCYDLNNNTAPANNKKNVYISGVPNNFDKKQLDDIAKIDNHFRENIDRTYREMFGSMAKIISRLRECGGYDIHGFVDCKFIKPEDFLFFIDGDDNIDCVLKTDTTIGGFIQRVCTEITI